MAEFETGPRELLDYERRNLQNLIDTSQVIYSGRVTKYGIFQIVLMRDDGSLPETYEESFGDDFGGLVGASIFSTELLDMIRYGIKPARLKVMIDHSQAPAKVNYESESKLATLDLEKLRLVNPAELVRERFVDEKGLLVARNLFGHREEMRRSAQIYNLNLVGNRVIYLDLSSSGKKDAVVINPRDFSLVPRIITES